MVIPPGDIPPYQRRDLDHANPADRPTNEAYDGFVFLAARYRRSGYDDGHLLADVPFLEAGPLFNAIHLWSTHALVEIAEIVGADASPHREDAQRIHAALLSELWDPESSRFGALDVVRGERSVEDTIVSFAPLLDPDLPAPSSHRSWPTSAPPASTRTGRTGTSCQLRPHGRGLRRAPLLARARLDQHQLAALERAGAARPGRGGRRDPAEQPGARRGPGSTSTSIRSAARRSAPTGSAGRPP